MPKNNSKARKDQRRATAAENAKAVQVICAHCDFKTHREGRCNAQP